MKQASAGLQQMLFPESEIDLRFEAWLEEFPAAYEKFVELALEVKQAGYGHYSADAIVHRLRWHYAIELRLEGGFRWNDHFTSRLARKAMHDHPSLNGFFEVRRLRSQG